MRRFPLMVLAAATLLAPACADDTWTPETGGGGEEMTGGDGLRTDEQAIAAEVEGQLITSPFGDRFDGFGASIAIDGNLAVVGAPLATERGVPRGAVYVFQRGDDGEWRYLERILPPRSGDRIVSPLESAQYVPRVGFTRDQVPVEVVPFPDDCNAFWRGDALDDGFFGWRVALDRGILVVSAPGAQAPTQGVDRNSCPSARDLAERSDYQNEGMAFAYVLDPLRRTFAWEATRDATGSVRPLPVVALNSVMYEPDAAADRTESIQLGPVAVFNDCEDGKTVRIALGEHERGSGRLAATAFEFECPDLGTYFTCEPIGRGCLPFMDPTGQNPVRLFDARQEDRDRATVSALDHDFDVHLGAYGLVLDQSQYNARDLSSGDGSESAPAIIAAPWNVLACYSPRNVSRPCDDGGDLIDPDDFPWLDPVCGVITEPGCFDQVAVDSIVAPRTGAALRDVAVHSMPHTASGYWQLDVAVDAGHATGCADWIPTFGLMRAWDTCPDNWMSHGCSAAGIGYCHDWRISVGEFDGNLPRRAVSSFEDGDGPRSVVSWYSRGARGFGFSAFAQESRRRIGHFGWDVDTDGNSTIVSDVVPIIPVDDNNLEYWRLYWNLPELGLLSRHNGRDRVIVPGVALPTTGQVFIYEGNRRGDDLWEYGIGESGRSKGE